LAKVEGSCFACVYDPHFACKSAQRASLVNIHFVIGIDSEHDLALNSLDQTSHHFDYFEEISVDSVISKLHVILT
jgi:hypothetical protein